MSTFHKDEMDKFYLKVDTVGITSVGRAELDRVAAIKALSDRKPVPVYGPQQDALINHTIFLGADTEMVVLAIGQPAEKPSMNERGQQVWFYYFDDYSRPTYLYFEQQGQYWVLVKAEKGTHTN